MSQSGTVQVPPKGIGKIAWRDLWKGLYYACAGQLLALVSFVGVSIFQEQPHFPNTWIEWLPYIKGLVYAAAGYVLAKFGVNNVGQVGQSDKPVVLVDQEHLEDLKQKADSNTSK